MSDSSNSLAVGVEGADAIDKAKLKVVINLQGEAAARLALWAESQHLHVNVAARLMLEEGMAENGLLRKMPKRKR